MAFAADFVSSAVDLETRTPPRLGPMPPGDGGPRKAMHEICEAPMERTAPTWSTGAWVLAPRLVLFLNLRPGRSASEALLSALLRKGLSRRAPAAAARRRFQRRASKGSLRLSTVLDLYVPWHEPSDALAPVSEEKNMLARYRQEEAPIAQETREKGQGRCMAQKAWLLFEVMRLNGQVPRA